MQELKRRKAVSEEAERGVRGGGSGALSDADKNCAKFTPNDVGLFLGNAEAVLTVSADSKGRARAEELREVAADSGRRGRGSVLREGRPEDAAPNVAAVVVRAGGGGAAAQGRVGVHKTQGVVGERQGGDATEARRVGGDCWEGGQSRGRGGDGARVAGGRRRLEVFGAESLSPPARRRTEQRGQAGRRRGADSDGFGCTGGEGGLRFILARLGDGNSV